MDNINPDHYKKKPVETFDKMIRIWGVQRVAEYCEINAFKYRERAGLKETSTIEEDIGKALWWEDKMKELLECDTIHISYGGTSKKFFNLDTPQKAKTVKKPAAPQKA